MTRPPLILADEPTGNLDSATSIEIMKLLTDLQASGMTIVFVTHEPDIAAYAARKLLLKDGAVIGDERQEPAREALDDRAGETLRLAARALRRNKLRSFLTALGIIIGVGAVIFMQSIGEGAKSRVRAQIESAGTNIVMLFSGSSQGPGGRGGRARNRPSPGKTCARSRPSCPRCAAVAPQMNAGQPVISETNTWNTQITGTTPDYFIIRNWPVSSGAMFTASDQASAAKNAVIGPTAAENLFGPGVDPIGQIIRIRDAPFTVIGVLERKGQNAMGSGPGRRDLHPAVRVPDAHAARTRQVRARPDLRERRVAGRDSARAQEIGAVAARAAPPRARRRGRLLHEQHGRDDQHADLDAGDRHAAAVAIALVSLIVGGIGVMNIMLVSVTERTREIGIRMAVGAQPADIMAQFLVEALVLATVGGALGVLFGVGSAICWRRSSAGRWRPARRSCSGAGGERRRGRVLRAVSGAQGVAARPDRGAALRMKGTISASAIGPAERRYSRAPFHTARSSIAMKKTRFCHDAM